MTMHDLATDLVEARRASPGDDILSTLVHSRVDGQPLSDRLLGGIFALFSTAGNDTTRSTTAHAMKLFADNPAQWTLLAAERTLIGTADRRDGPLRHSGDPLPPYGHHRYDARYRANSGRGRRRDVL